MAENEKQKTIYDKKMLLLLDKNLKEETIKVAENNHMSVNAFVRESIRRHISYYNQSKER
jgi:predicted HicB family RNase H-like nuclease